MKKLVILSLVALLMFGGVALYGAYSEVGGGAISGAGRSTGGVYSGDSAVSIGGGRSSGGLLEADSGPLGASTEVQPIPVVVIKSTRGSETYAKATATLSLSGDGSGYDIVSFNASNSNAKSSWLNVADYGIVAESLDVSGVPWSLNAGSTGETRTVNVWVKNALGVYSGRIVDTILLDETAPAAASNVLDVKEGTQSPDLDIADTSNVFGAWDAATDALSGIYGYNVRVLKDGDAVVTSGITTLTESVDLPGVVMIKGDTNRIEVTPIDNAGNLGTPVLSDGTTIGEPSVVLTKTAVHKGRDGSETKSGLVAVAGNILEYNFGFENNGTFPAKPVNVYDIIPDMETYATGSAATDLNSGTGTIYFITNMQDLIGTTSEPANKNLVLGLRWEISEVPAGETGSVSYQVKLN